MSTTTTEHQPQHQDDDENEPAWLSTDYDEM